MRKYNYIVSVLMTLVAGVIFYDTAAYSGTFKSAQQDSAVWPRMIAVALILCSIVLVIQTLLDKKNADTETVVIDWKSEGMKKVYMTLAAIVVFLILNEIIGMLLALLVLIPAIEWIMGCKSKLMYIALPVGMVVFLYIFFYKLMMVRFPMPFWA